MYSAFAWGFIGGASLILGGLLALNLKIGRRALGLIMAFGAGVLISAVAYELVLDAFETTAGADGIALGLFSGAIVFYVGDRLIDRLGGAGRKASSGEQAEGSTLPIVLGTVLDGIPESIVLGLTVLSGGVSVAMLAAIFISNLPEAIAGTTGLLKARWPRGRIMGLWTLVALASGLAAAAGYLLLDHAPPSAIAFIQAFAGGALLTMLADTMMPARASPASSSPSWLSRSLAPELRPAHWSPGLLRWRDLRASPDSRQPIADSCLRGNWLPIPHTFCMLRASVRRAAVARGRRLSRRFSAGGYCGAHTSGPGEHASEATESPRSLAVRDDCRRAAAGGGLWRWSRAQPDSGSGQAGRGGG